MTNDINQIFALLNKTPNWHYQLGQQQNALQGKSLDQQLKEFEDSLNLQYGQVGASTSGVGGAGDGSYGLAKRYQTPGGGAQAGFIPAMDLPYARGF